MARPNLNLIEGIHFIYKILQKWHSQYDLINKNKRWLVSVQKE